MTRRSSTRPRNWTRGSARPPWTVGGTTTLTFTITNTVDLKAKNGWSFTDTLPTGLAVSGAATTTCPAGVATAAGGTVSGAGNLTDGMASSTVSVPLTSGTRGQFTNGASNVVEDGLWPPANTAVVFNDPDVSGISLVKSTDLTSPAQYVVGHVVTYSFTVTNTGNVPLNSFTIGENGFTGTGTLSAPNCPTTTLAPLASTTCTATYTITAADLIAGSVSNTAVATGTPPSGPPVSDTSSVVIAGTPAPRLELTKTVDASALQAPPRVGNLLTYRFTATNTGNVPVTAVQIADALPGISGLSYSWPGAVGTLNPTESVEATASYPLTQADIDAGHVANLATATGLDPGNVPVPSDSASTDTPLTASPALTLTKTADASDITSPAAVGGIITYQFTATNTGNVTLADVMIADVLPGLSALSYAWPDIDGQLAPGASVVATATYQVTQANIDAGHVANQAIATGTAPDRTTPRSDPAETDTPLGGGPALQIVKSASPSDQPATGHLLVRDHEHRQRHRRQRHGGRGNHSPDRGRCPAQPARRPRRRWRRPTR
ncbi:MAG: hypothetical protein WDM88_04440 [Galbitalea sp.]